MSKNYIWGYCPNCKELKDDNYRLWLSHRKGYPILDENKRVKIGKGCLDCGYRLISMGVIKKHIPELAKELENLNA